MSSYSLIFSCFIPFALVGGSGIYYVRHISARKKEICGCSFVEIVARRKRVEIVVIPYLLLPATHVDEKKRIYVNKVPGIPCFRDKIFSSFESDRRILSFCHYEECSFKRNPPFFCKKKLNSSGTLRNRGKCYQFNNSGRFTGFIFGI